MKKILMWLSTLRMSAWIVAAPAANVLLGLGDLIKISVHEHTDLSLETRMSETGIITLPLPTPSFNGLTSMDPAFAGTTTFLEVP